MVDFSRLFAKLVNPRKTANPRLTLSLWGRAFFLGFALLLPGTATARGGEHIERVVLIYRHGVRAPLANEHGLASIAPAPLPTWTTPESLLTPHGAKALELLAAYQRHGWQRAGLLPGTGCPSARDLVIWTNTVSRTIASGHALAAGLAPGCDLPVGHLAAGHLAPDRHDPVFEQLEASTEPFDGARAATDVIAYTGGMPKLQHRLAPALAAMARIIGHDLPSDPGHIAPGADGRGLDVVGPVIDASGTAQIFLLQYMEGLPADQIGWGRADAAAIAAVSPLHAALFEALDRSPYIAPRVAGVLARRMLSALFDADQPRVTLLVGHDNNIAALAALLDTQFKVPGLGWNDPPPGGALGLALVRGADGRQRVRAFYVAATPGQVRRLTVLDAQHRPAELSLNLGLCHNAGRECAAATFRNQLLAKIEGAGR